MSKLYAVALRLFADTAPERIDRLLSKYGDWLRYNGETWFVYTDAPSQLLMEDLRRELSSRDSALVMRVEPRDFAGWVPSNVRFWLQSKASSPTLAEVLSDTGMASREGTPFARE
jgi:hypothetical protein